jgi:hypothetical protein
MPVISAIVANRLSADFCARGCRGVTRTVRQVAVALYVVVIAARKQMVLDKVAGSPYIKVTGQPLGTIE